MKKIINFVLTLPLVSLILIYLYIFINLVNYGYPQFYSVDPKYMSKFGVIYDLIINFSGFGIYLLSSIGLFILFYKILFIKLKIFEDLYFWIYILGLLLIIIVYYFDPYGFLFWFFD